MNKKTSLVLVILLLAGAVIAIYQELMALPVLCYYAEHYCLQQCGGVFDLDSCWEDSETGLWWCTFSCINFQRSCGWMDPTWGICVDPY